MSVFLLFLAYRRKSFLIHNILLCRTKVDFTNVQSYSPMDVNLKKASKPKRTKKNSRVQVMVLNAELGRFADHSALQFKKEHLYGNRIRRDTCMLKAR